MRRVRPTAPRVLAAIIIAGLGLSTAACGDPKPQTPVVAPSVAAPAATSAAPSPEPTPTTPTPSVGEGITVSTCEAQGSTVNEIVTYDTDGINVGSTRFNSTPDPVYKTIDSIGGCAGSYGGRQSATSFDYVVEPGKESFTKFFVTKKIGDSTEIGYFPKESSDTDFVSLSKPSGDDDAVTKDMYPSYHSGTKRVYYCDMSDENKLQLMSVSPTGGDNRKANVDESAFRGCDNETLYMPDTEKPAAADMKDTSIFTPKGKKIDTSNIDLTGFKNDPVPVGIVPNTGNRTYVVHDKMSLYQVTGTKATKIHKGNGREITSAAMNAATGDIAFTRRLKEAGVGLYYMAKGKQPVQITKVQDKGMVEILYFN